MIGLVIPLPHTALVNLACGNTPGEESIRWLLPFPQHPVYNSRGRCINVAPIPNDTRSRTRTPGTGRFAVGLVLSFLATSTIMI